MGLTGMLENSPGEEKLAELGFVFSNDELAVIGSIVAHWASAESSLGTALMIMLEVFNIQVARELIIKTPFRRKIELLHKFSKHEDLNDCVDPHASELLWIYNRCKQARDIIVHGNISPDLSVISSKFPQSERGISLSSHSRFLPMSQLLIQDRAARYAASVARSLMMLACLGEGGDDETRQIARALPPRPQGI
ncbi:MAG: hypothetical protein QOD42_3020 [Sphingomonadales bacterium]|jgi:hypothetical protein|nr:hypothetical protein [Sphingomonadales bacterium]